MPKAPPTPASVLNSLMEEHELNPFSLAKKIALSTSAVRQIAIGKTGITIPTALRLAKFFGQCPSFWLDLQLQVDMQTAANDKELQNTLKGISKVGKPSAPAKGKKAPAKPPRAASLADKRKEAAKVPGAKPARGKAPAKKGAPK